MNYRIVGNTVPAVEFKLNAGESIYTQRGGMTWKTPGVSMKTNTNGETLSIGSTVPGGVVPINLVNFNDFAGRILSLQGKR